MADTPAYDLFVLLDPETPEERRAEVIDRIRSQINGGGTLKGDADWGMRRLTFEIDHREEAQYHLFQFEAVAELLNELDRTLSIDDGVLRHRIIRLPGPAPDVTPKPSPEEPRRTEERGDRDRDRGRGGRGPRPGGSENGAEATEAPASEPVTEAAGTEPEATEVPVAEAPAEEQASSEAPPQEQAGGDAAAASERDEPA